jgi:hypothetical protein
MSQRRSSKQKVTSEPPGELRPAPSRRQKVFLIVSIVLLVAWLAIIAWMAIS